MNFAPLLTLLLAVASASRPFIEWHSGFSQVYGSAIPGESNDAPNSDIVYLGNFGNATGCAEACGKYNDSRCWSFTWYGESVEYRLFQADTNCDAVPDSCSAELCCDDDTSKCPEECTEFIGCCPGGSDAFYLPLDFTNECYGLTGPRYDPVPVENATVGMIMWDCRDATDCSLNGECHRGVCKCDAAWSGHKCENLNLLPTTRDAGYRGVDGGHNTSSWGGAILEGSDGQWHMWAAEMTEHCGIQAWAQNSRIIHAVSDSPTGKYERQDVTWEVFSHEPEVVKAPTGEFVMYFTAQLRSEYGECDCCRSGFGPCDGSTGAGDCPDDSTSDFLGTLTKTKKESRRRADHPKLGDSDPSYMSYAVPPTKPGGNWTWSEPQRFFTDYFGSDTNFAPVILANGSLVAIWREWTPLGGSRPHLATASDWRNVSTYIRHDLELFPDLGAMGTEDPFVYLDKRGNFHAVFHNMYGYDTDAEWWLDATGGHAYSVDGINWVYTGVAWGTVARNDSQQGDVVEYTDGSSFRFTRRERPHLIQDSNGEIIGLSTANQYGLSQSPVPSADNGDASYTMVQPVATNADKPGRPQPRPRPNGPRPKRKPKRGPN